MFPTDGVIHKLATIREAHQWTNIGMTMVMHLTAVPRR
jgi:hypothetical protein